MMHIYILLIAQALVFSSYVWAISKDYGVQPSISASYYVLPENLKSLFWLFCFFTGIAFPFIMETPLAVAACGGLWLVGAAAAYKLGKTAMTAHLIGSYSAILLALLAIWLKWNMPYPIVAFALIAGLFHFAKVKNFVWWVEVFAFIIIWISMLLLNLLSPL